jgi:hypothetical protein
MTADRRRAPAGQAWGCPGCHDATKLRAKDDVCRDCRAKLDRADALIRQHMEQTTHAWFQYARVVHWNPNFYFGFTWSDGTERNLANAFFDVVLKAAEATRFPEGEARYSASTEGLYRRRGALVRRPRAWGRQEQQDYGAIVLLREPLAAALNTLDRTMVAAIADAEANAFTKGADLLRSLNLGDITMDRFNRDTAQHVKRMRQLQTAAQEDE